MLPRVVRSASMVASRAARRATLTAARTASPPLTSLRNAFVIRADDAQQPAVFLWQVRRISGSTNGKKPGKATKAAPIAAATLTAFVKLVGKPGVRLVGIDHAPGKPVASLATEAAHELGLDVSTLVLYEVTDEAVKAKLDDMELLSLDDLPKHSVRKLPSLQPLTSDTVLLAVGTPRVGVERRPATAASSEALALQLHASLPYAKELKIPGEPDDGCSLLVLEDAQGNPVQWPGLRSNKLFIRPVYREFYEREDMLGKLAARPPHMAPHSLVRGVPGIGKSSFALYCLWRLMKEGQHVLYSYPVGLRGQAVVEFGSGPPDDAVAIADGTDAFAIAGGKHTLLVTSPRQPYIAEFEKHSVSFYMDMPTTEEVKLLRDTCFPEVRDALHDDIVDARISRWGRVPRFVLAHSSDEEKAFAKTVNLLNVTALRNLLLQQTEIRDQQDVSFRVVHYDFPHEKAARNVAAPSAQYCWPLKPGVPPRDYTSVALRWATPHMQECVWDFFVQHQARDRLALLSELFRDKVILSFSGTLWEKWASVAMARGSGDGGFRIRRLAAPEGQPAALGPAADKLLRLEKDASGSWRLTVPAAETVGFIDTADLQKRLTVASGSSKRYVAPTGFAAIDFVEAQLPHAAGSNASVSDVHKLVVQGELLKNGWRAIAEGLPSLFGQQDGPLIHFWLVPPVVFGACEAGPLQIAASKSDSTIAKLSPERRIAELELNAAIQRARQLAPRIVQYAVEVPEPVELMDA